MNKTFLTSSLVFLCLNFMACAVRKDPPQNSSRAMSSQQQKDTTTCPLRLPKSHLCLRWVWTQEPTNEAPGEMILEFSSKQEENSAPLLLPKEAVLKVVLWMPSMGHGSLPVLVESIPGNPPEIQDKFPSQEAPLLASYFKAQRVFFIMPGDWEIKFQIYLGGTLHEEVTQALWIP